MVTRVPGSLGLISLVLKHVPPLFSHRYAQLQPITPVSFDIEYESRCRVNGSVGSAYLHLCYFKARNGYPAVQDIPVALEALILMERSVKLACGFNSLQECIRT